jgi:cell wall-associated NlpC family hydrolase
MSRILAATAALLAVLVPAVSAEATPLPPETPGARSGGRAATPSWAQAEIRVVVAHGLMSPTVASFRSADPLTQGELSALVAGLTKRPAQPVASPSAPVTIAQLDAKLTQALGLADEAAAFARGVRSAGLAPPTRFGTEVVARLLGLRTNHPAAQDDLELLPADPATRAEAAFSAARILRFQGWELQSIETAAASFILEQPSPWERRVLATAVRFIGYPYVWGGTSEIAEAPFGISARGGFDCSGFVWRVYKLQGYPGGSALGATLRGRTTMAMSGEVPRSRRIPFSRLAPADLVFFGARGPNSKPAAVDHMGIYLGGGWIIHSSAQGVALAPISGWYKQRFAWGRRPLVESGLEPPR